MHKVLLAGGLAAALLWLNSRGAASSNPWARVDPGGFPGAPAGTKDLPALYPGQVNPPDPIVQPTPAALQAPAALAVITANSMRSGSLARTLPPPPGPGPTVFLSANPNLQQQANAVARSGGIPKVLIPGLAGGLVVATPGHPVEAGYASVPMIQRLTITTQRLSAGIQAGQSVTAGIVARQRPVPI